MMGILNVTPDSFSDGGKYLAVEKAVEHALTLEEEGAEIIDIGGESTRPGAATVPVGEELRRVLPVIRELRRRSGVAISIDTRKPEVAEAALAEGAEIVNDVEAARGGDEMLRCVGRTGAGYVAMHMQGHPDTMQKDPRYDDVVREVGEFFRGIRTRLLETRGTEDQWVLDPGIGFGKRLEHNLSLLANLGEFRSLGRPILLGVSRKSFLAGYCGEGTANRLPGAMAASILAREQGTSIFRTHDVGATLAGLRTAEAIRKSVRAGKDPS